MLQFLSEHLLNSFTNEIFTFFVRGVLVMADIAIYLAEPIFFQSPIALFLIFLGLVFTKGDEPFHWKRFKEDPMKALNACITHEMLRFLVRVYITAFAAFLFIFALLLAVGFILPEEGMAVRDKFSDDNPAPALAMGSFALLMLMIIFIKAGCYSMIGIIKSPGDFKLKMIIW